MLQGSGLTIRHKSRGISSECFRKVGQIVRGRTPPTLFPHGNIARGAFLFDAPNSARNTGHLQLLV
jgi:hypothetical protein